MRHLRIAVWTYGIVHWFNFARMEKIWYTKTNKVQDELRKGYRYSWIIYFLLLHP